MPFYEYQCKSCGHELEAMQKVSEPPLRKCPHCGKSQLQRLMSAPVFRLKGGGWYETDFKGDKDNQRNLADRPEEPAKDSKATDAKATDAKAKDEKGKDGEAKPADSKAADAAPAKETGTAKDSSTAKDKPADKPAAQKPSGASKRGLKRVVKKAAKVKRRR
jgi:putative FmdB family regulatory protein